MLVKPFKQVIVGFVKFALVAFVLATAGYFWTVPIVYSLALGVGFGIVGLAHKYVFRSFLALGLMLLIGSALVTVKAVPKYFVETFHPRVVDTSPVTPIGTNCSVDLGRDLEHLNGLRDKHVLSDSEYAATRAAAMVHYTNCRPSGR